MKLRTTALLLAFCAVFTLGAFASGEASQDASDELFAPLDFPADSTIVSATAYTVYTKSPSSMQDAVIKATLYWDLTNDEVYAIRFLQPMLPFDDNGISMGWACVSDEALLEKKNMDILWWFQIRLIEAENKGFLSEFIKKLFTNY